MGAVGRLRRSVLVLPLLWVLVLSACSDAGGPVHVDTRGLPDAERAACRGLLQGAPQFVADQEARSVAPDDASAVAWGDPPIVLVCGADEPEELDRLSPCTTVNGVDWFIPQEQLDADAPVDLTMTTMYREPAVQVRMPAEYWPPATTLADVARVVRHGTEKTGSCV